PTTWCATRGPPTARCCAGRRAAGSSARPGRRPASSSAAWRASCRTARPTTARSPRPTSGRATAVCQPAPRTSRARARASPPSPPSPRPRRSTTPPWPASEPGTGMGRAIVEMVGSLHVGGLNAGLAEAFQSVTALDGQPPERSTDLMGKKSPDDEMYQAYAAAAAVAREALREDDPEGAALLEAASAADI